MIAASDTIGLPEAAALLHLSEHALMRKARAGIVPGAKIGRQWVFIRDDLLALIREQARGRACLYIDGKTLRTGGVDFSSTTERSASQLARQIESELKNLKPRLALVRGGRRD